MIKSFPRLYKMKFCYRWVSELFVMAVVFVTLNADNKQCEEEIYVRRNTNYKATLGERLEIVCPVRFCNGAIPIISWFKLKADFVPVNLSDRVQTDWTGNNNEGKSFLIFKNVQSSDLGSYHCRVGIIVSHTINVTLQGDSVNGTLQHQSEKTKSCLQSILKFTDGPYCFTDTTFTENENRQMWLYLYTSVGIVGFVIIVTVISVLSIRGCTGKTRKKAQSENQYIDIPMVEQPVHPSNHQTLPRASPRGPPAHRTSRKKKSPSAPPHNDNEYGLIEAGRHRNGAVEEGGSVVYAALNHERLATASPRPRMVTEESSEYAAIKVS